MKMHPVKSSTITSIGHGGDCLHVTYKGGVTYCFDGVTAEQHAKLISAGSHGKYLHKMGIKGKKI